MKQFSLLFAMLFAVSQTFVSAQNLVPNPSFDNAEASFCLFGGEIEGAQGWYKPTGAGTNGGTSDAFNTCVQPLFPIPGQPSTIPDNVFGSQQPRSGDGYAGYFALTSISASTDDGEREYMQVKLTQALEVGRTYCIEFYVSLSDNSTLACDGIGLHLSETAITRADFMPFTQVPQVTSNGVINDDSGWVKVEGTWTATYPAEYLTIGSFVQTKQHQTSGHTPAGFPPMPGSYYFVDDVKVEECTPDDVEVNAIASSGDVCPGSCVELTALDLTGTGNKTFTWDHGIGSGEGPHQVCPTKNETYQVIMTDNGSGEKDTATVEVKVFGEVTLTNTVVNENCGKKDGSISINASGSGTLSYTWDNGGTGATQSDLAAGEYTVTVTDGNGCTASELIEVQSTGDLTITVEDTAFADCGRHGSNNASSTVSVSGGTPGYTYEWNTVPAQTTAKADGLKPGEEYEVIVTDNSGCIQKQKVVIEEYIKVNVTQKIDPTCGTCDNGTVLVSPTGGTPPYTYRWNDANETTTALVTGLPAGKYHVLVTDANGCFNLLDVYVGIVGIDEANPADLVAIYPNPNAGTFTIDFGDLDQERGFLNVYEMSGRLVYSDAINNLQKVEVSVPDLGSGIYLMQINTDSGLSISKRLQIVR